MTSTDILPSIGLDHTGTPIANIVLGERPDIFLDFFTVTAVAVVSGIRSGSSASHHGRTPCSYKPNTEVQNTGVWTAKFVGTTNFTET